MGTKTRALCLILLLASAIFAASADESPPAVPTGTGVLFGTALFSDGKAAANLPVVILVRSQGSETIYRLITDSGGGFVLSSGTGKYEIDALLANSSTATIGYAATAQADTSKEENVTLIFYPAGSVAGTVQSEGSPVSGANVKVACPSSGFDYARVNGGATVQAGGAGDFLFKALPAGTCIISASTDSLAGSAEAKVEHQKTVSVAVDMERKAVQGDILPAALGIIVIAIVLYAAFQFLQKGKKETREAPHYGQVAEAAPASQKKKAAKQKEEEDGGMSSKLSDPKVKAVLATLTDRESEIVKFLFKSNGRAKRSQLQHKLLIPKTSLLRNLRSLERKRIVKLTPFGRNLLAEIDDWLHK